MDDANIVAQLPTEFETIFLQWPVRLRRTRKMRRNQGEVLSIPVALHMMSQSSEGFPMSRSLKALGLAVPAAVLMAAPALAQTASSWWWWPRPVTNVPEIDASSGLLAIAAIAAILALVVERRRRA